MSWSTGLCSFATSCLKTCKSFSQLTLMAILGRKSNLKVDNKHKENSVRSGDSICSVDGQQ